METPTGNGLNTGSKERKWNQTLVFRAERILVLRCHGLRLETKRAPSSGALHGRSRPVSIG